MSQPDTYSMSLPVYYEDTDAGGVVYYANYLKFMERARTEWLRNAGFEQDALMEDPGIVFAVRSVQVDYRAPARFNEWITIDTVIENVGKASISFDHKVKRKSDGQLLVAAKVKVACVDFYTFKPTALPASIQEIC